MASIDRIWDEPVAPPSPPPQSLSHASEEENDRMPDAPPRREHNVDDLFAGVGDLPDDPVGDGRTALLSSSPARLNGGDGDNGGAKDKNAPKPKKKPMRLDEGRLIGPSGFPQLIADTKEFKIKGKGHEASDLNRLLQVYQFWTHRLYPKTPFKDTVDRVEKLCHSKRMHNQLSIWRDEARGISQDNEEEDPADPPGPDSERVDYASSSPRAATGPPSSHASDVDTDAMDANARINARRADTPLVSDVTSTDKAAMPDDEEEMYWQDPPSAGKTATRDDEDEWAAMDDAAPPVANRTPRDDEDEWAAMDDADQMHGSAMSAPKNPPQADQDEWDVLDEREQAANSSEAPKPKASAEEDMDDMYIDGS